MKTWNANWLVTAFVCGSAQAAPERPPAPVRDPVGPGYVEATELPDGAVPRADQGGNFIIGPTHAPAPETIVSADVPQGTIKSRLRKARGLLEEQLAALATSPALLESSRVTLEAWAAAIRERTGIAGEGRRR